VSAQPPRALRVACPGCGASAEYSPANPWRPFCSERCRLSDLGAWASESYRIPLRREAAEEDDSLAGNDSGTLPQS
jgi:endogenous inhibitor of DNA gyrase (YacG/DUF329 family)